MLGGTINFLPEELQAALMEQIRLMHVRWTSKPLIRKGIPEIGRSIGMWTMQR